MTQNFERLLTMSHLPEPLHLFKNDHKSNQEKITEAYRQINEKLDVIIAKRNKKAKTGT